MLSSVRASERPLRSALGKLTLAVLAAAVLLGCHREGGSTASQRLAAVVAAVGSDVCVPGAMGGGRLGAPILVFEEQHLSRAGQIEQAIALVRLYRDSGLRHIVLEGYVKDETPSSASWFDDVSRDLDPVTRASLAAAFLRQGEIGSAEFLRMVRPDVSLDPGEVIEEYAPNLDPAAAAAPLVYLHGIAAVSLPSRDVERVQQEIQALPQLPPDEQQRWIGQISASVLAGEKWAQKAASRIQGAASVRVSADQALALSNEIFRRAAELGLSFPESERRAMERNLLFWRARRAASRTLAAEAGRIANRNGVEVVALCAGAAHTEAISDALGKARRPYAVLTPRTLKTNDHRGDLTWAMLERKYRGRSVSGEGYASVISQAFAPDERKPEPALFQSQFQAQAEMMALVGRTAQRVAQVSGSGDPQLRFSEADLRGRFVSISPDTIHFVAEPGAPGGRAVVFRVNISASADREPKSIWVKTAAEGAIAESQGQPDYETLLRKALAEVQSANPAGPRVEDGVEVVRVHQTSAAFATSESAVRGVSLSAP
jgi:hypothetical protein